MAHQRQIIREAIRAALLSKTTAGTRVYETRAVPWGRTELPAISIYTDRESVADDSRDSAPRELERNLDLAVHAYVEAGSNVDDAMDALALAIEKVMHADPTFGGVCSDSILSETSMAEDEIGSKPVGELILAYSISYRTGAPEAADVTLDDLETVDAVTRLGGTVVAQDQAEDVIEDLDA